MYRRDNRIDKLFGIFLHEKFILSLYLFNHLLILVQIHGYLFCTLCYNPTTFSLFFQFRPLGGLLGLVVTGSHITVSNTTMIGAVTYIQTMCLQWSMRNVACSISGFVVKQV
jgi:hypothetical protein